MNIPGYACPRCGAWVGEAQTHSCATYTNPALLPGTRGAVWTREDVDTIIRLLKEIEYHVRTKR